MYILIHFLFSWSVQNNQMLKVLNLAYNGFGQEGTVALADAFKVNSTLTELDIT